MKNLDEFINKKREEKIRILKKELKKENKRFKFIREFIEENYNEIINYLNTDINAYNEEVYNIADEIYLLIKDYGVGRTFVELTNKSKFKTLKEYLPIKLGIFNIDGNDDSGHLVITEKGEKIRKKYFV